MDDNSAGIPPTYSSSSSRWLPGTTTTRRWFSRRSCAGTRPTSTTTHSGARWSSWSSSPTPRSSSSTPSSSGRSQRAGERRSKGNPVSCVEYQAVGPWQNTFFFKRWLFAERLFYDLLLVTSYFFPLGASGATSVALWERPALGWVHNPPRRHKYQNRSQLFAWGRRWWDVSSGQRPGQASPHGVSYYLIAAMGTPWRQTPSRNSFPFMSNFTLSFHILKYRRGPSPTQTGIRFSTKFFCKSTDDGNIWQLHRKLIGALILSTKLTCRLSLAFQTFTHTFGQNLIEIFYNAAL